MRHTPGLAFLAALILTTSCSQYDRELLGDPEPAPAEEAGYTEAVPTDADDSLDVGMFSELRYHGQWYRLDPYGWVWRPSVVTGWQPFVHGHWIWTQYGWMWVDYDPWGWATSHYGYWVIDYSLGWVWIPDYTWSPVQCEWLIYDDYVCWSPVPPPGVRYRDPWDSDGPWVSVPKRRFKSQDVAHYREMPKFKSDSDLYRGAPDVADIEQHGPRFSRVEVQLDRRVVGEREFAKVKYPPDQQQIIQDQRVRIKTNDTSARFSPAPQTPGQSPVGNGGTVGPTRPVTETKSKAGKSGADSKGSSKTDRKFKDRRGDKDEKKDDGKSKSGKKG